jgi:hypothetical protein
MFGKWDVSFIGLTLRTWTLVLLLSELGLIFLFLPGPWMKKIYFEERRMVLHQLGPEAFKKIEAQSDVWFKNLVVDCGVLSGSYELCQRQGTDRFDDRGLSKLFADRLDVFWVAVRQLLFRISVVAVWMWCGLLMLVATTADALLQRQMLKCKSGAASPALYHYAAVGIAVVFMILLLVPMMPYPIMEPLAVPAGLALICLALWAGLVRSAKRI